MGPRDKYRVLAGPPGARCGNIYFILIYCMNTNISSRLGWLRGKITGEESRDDGTAYKNCGRLPRPDEHERGHQ